MNLGQRKRPTRALRWFDSTPRDWNERSFGNVREMLGVNWSNERPNMHNNIRRQSGERVGMVG